MKRKGFFQKTHKMTRKNMMTALLVIPEFWTQVIKVAEESKSILSKSATLRVLAIENNKSIGIMMRSSELIIDAKSALNFFRVDIKKNSFSIKSGQKFINIAKTSIKRIFYRGLHVKKRM
jgi:hypothetical protein